MTVIEEWKAIQSLEPAEIGFTVTTSVEIGTPAVAEVQGETYGLDQRRDSAFCDAEMDGITEVEHFGETDTDWEVQAACRSSEGSTDLFFSEELTDIVAAKRICADCPVIAPCLEGAISRAEPCGVWGGQLFSNGRVLAQKRRRGRPPKVARPEDQLPVVPIPAHLQKLIA